MAENSRHNHPIDSPNWEHKMQAAEKYYFQATGKRTNQVRFTSEPGERAEVLKAAEEYASKHPQQQVVMFLLDEEK
jgi:hypothetical protein